VSVVLASTLSGEKEVLGLWVEQTEGARFWLGVLNELKTRGVEDMLMIAPMWRRAWAYVVPFLPADRLQRVTDQVHVAESLGSRSTASAQPSKHGDARRA
jgi:transposase-like protein